LHERKLDRKERIGMFLGNKIAVITEGEARSLLATLLSRPVARLWKASSPYNEMERVPGQCFKVRHRLDSRMEINKGVYR